VVQSKNESRGLTGAPEYTDSQLMIPKYQTSA
jgi:hypothetical protein